MSSKLYPTIVLEAMNKKAVNEDIWCVGSVHRHKRTYKLYFVVQAGEIVKQEMSRRLINLNDGNRWADNVLIRGEDKEKFEYVGKIQYVELQGGIITIMVR